MDDLDPRFIQVLILVVVVFVAIGGGWLT